MKKVRLSRLYSSISLFALLLLFSHASMLSICLHFSSTTVGVEPSVTNAQLGDTLAVNITVSDVSDLAGWDFKLYWLREILNGTSVVEGPFLTQAGTTYFSIISFNDNYNSTHGLAWVSNVLLGHEPGSYGSGTLAMISFQTKDLGSTWLWLTETKLVDSTAKSILHSAIDGLVNVGSHDVAIAGISLSKNIVAQGYGTDINITAQNQGNYSETITVALRANLTSVASQDITLLSGEHSVIVFHWNTSGFSKGNHTISAVAWPVFNETDLEDNNMTDGCVFVSIPGDINGDQFVNAKDAVMLGRAFGSERGEPKYNSNADINNDGYVNAKDAAILGPHFGQSWS